MTSLTRFQLNRALLERQLLLRRSVMRPLEAIRHLNGMQSQIPNPPYIGLWSRLQTFTRDDLTQLIADGSVVRAAMMRSTLHLIAADDHNPFRATLQPALERALRSFFGKRAKSLDINKLLEVAGPYLATEPRTTGELKARLLEAEPEADGDALAYAVRAYLPLLQVPPGGTWGSGARASYVTAEATLGQLPEPDLETLLHRYLLAFGPASVMDFQFWTGMTRLKDEIKPLVKDLVVYQDEDGRELLDLPNAPLPDADTPAPVRFIPPYDNLIIAHKDRRRVLADADYKRVFLSAARVEPTILIDGFVAGTWTTQRNGDDAGLIITVFRPISRDTQDALAVEGEHLLRFIEEDATTYRVDFAS